ncbi:MAG: 1-phosphofructokinase family hexose kinase [Oscillospiraceae bacterium]|nr:1-phosphofructokinase family hexose kinase [Oscillospiraceae bacterium]
MNIITLTLSPAFDMHCSGEVMLNHENLIQMELCQAGGKGVNISRALVNAGYANTAVLLLGEENADSFLRSLSADGVRAEVVSVPGRIRENITIHTPDGKETRISFPGFAVESDALSKVTALLEGKLNKDSALTMTGRVPEGMELNEVKTFLQRAAEQGAKVVVDSRSFDLDDLLEVKPWLIKPNQEEISTYLGENIDSIEQAAKAAVVLHEKGIANVMVSMGGLGAVLACDAGVFHAEVPQVEVRSTIGAGDSSVAGFLAAAGKGADAAECLRLAVAFGTAACMTEGTLPPQRADIEFVYSKTTVQKI